MKVSSASTIPLNVRGLSSAGARRNRCRQRKAVVGWTPQNLRGLRQADALDHRLGMISQRSFLRRCAMGVLVNALNVRPQLLQRNRNSPFERPQPTISRPAQWGQPWLWLRSTPTVSSASFLPPRLPPLPDATPSPEAPASPSAFVRVCKACRRCSALIPAIADSHVENSSARVESSSSTRSSLNQTNR